jgi:SAM-dependent methyltransferase
MHRIKSFIPPSPASLYSESADSITRALLGYSEAINRTDMNRIKKSFASLSDDDLKWLSEVHSQLGIQTSLENRISESVEQNQLFLSELLRFLPLISHAEPTPFHSKSIETIEARVRLLPWVVAREWGEEPNIGADREVVHFRVLQAVREYACASARILVPGSSCGRLLYELAVDGHSPLGVEFDALRLLATSFMFQTSSLEETIIRPLVLETCNRLYALDNVGDVFIPEILIDPVVLARISINGNEFMEAASGMLDDDFDVVVTTYFLDTITDTTKYVDEISRVLKPGGVWINFGPLNYHYACERSAPQTARKELSLEELDNLISANGFRQLREPEIVHTTYMGNMTSMMRTKFGCRFCVYSKDQ